MSKKSKHKVLTDLRSPGPIEKRLRHKSAVASICPQSIAELAELDLWNQVIRVRQGLPSISVAEMSAALCMTRATFLNDLQLSESLIEGRIKKRTPLSLVEGLRVLRAAKVLARAVDVFEDRAIACTWLKRKIRSLDGQTPISLLVTNSGFELVMQKLGHIEYGVVA